MKIYFLIILLSLTLTACISEENVVKSETSSVPRPSEGSQGGQILEETPPSFITD